MTAHEKNVNLARAIAYRLDPTGTKVSAQDMLPSARTLRRAQLTLHRWCELECGDGKHYVERDENTGVPRMYTEHRYLAPNDPRCWRVIPDREKGALARVEKVCKALGLHYYYQGDPRGCALYVDVVPLPDNNYTRGVACL